MRQILFLILFTTEVFCYAQSYEEAVDKCTQAFQNSFHPTNMKEFESKMEQQLYQLRKCVVGLKFPAFKATTIGGRTYTLDELKGRIVLINLWFITCPPCVAEMPILNELQNEFSRDDFVIVSFGLDDNKLIREFIQKQPIDFDVIADSKKLIENKFKMSFGYPTNIFLDREGTIIDFKTGGAVDEVGLKKTKEEFQKLIKEQRIK